MSSALRVASRLATAAAAALLLLAAAVALVGSGPRTWLLTLQEAAGALLPAAVRGLFVFPLPTGGAFRGDVVVVAIVLLVLGHVLSRAASSLR